MRHINITKYKPDNLKIKDVIGNDVVARIPTRTRTLSGITRIINLHLGRDYFASKFLTPEEEVKEAISSGYITIHLDGIVVRKFGG